jgi:hypothetical protein
MAFYPFPQPYCYPPMYTHMCGCYGELMHLRERNAELQGHNAHLLTQLKTRDTNHVSQVQDLKTHVSELALELTVSTVTLDRSRNEQVAQASLHMAALEAQVETHLKEHTALRETEHQRAIENSTRRSRRTRTPARSLLQ